MMSQRLCQGCLRQHKLFFRKIHLSRSPVIISPHNSSCPTFQPSRSLRVKSDIILNTHRRSLSTIIDSDDESETNKFESPDVELDWGYLSDVDNKDAIKRNIQNRKGHGDIDKLHKLLEKLRAVRTNNLDGCYTNGQHTNHMPEDFLQNKNRDMTVLEKELHNTALSIPNHTHPQVLTEPDAEGRLLDYIGDKKAEFDFPVKSVIELGEHLNALRVRDVAFSSGPRNYYLIGPLAQLEQALVRYTTDYLQQHGFKMMSVPNLIYPEIIEGCGFGTHGERSQVYRLDPHLYGDVCLAGTGEMPLAGFVMNHGFAWEELPQKMMTVSQCYRAETSTVDEEKGIYRVHQFTKVEMFCVTGQDQGKESQVMMDNFLDIQTQLYSRLGLYCRILDMPSHELGASAHRKYDIETWMPAKSFWGEISSTSNCTDYQSRRLDVRYWNKAGNLRHCHTVNGTACAVPRLIMAILESHQNKDMTVDIPEVLQPYMNGLKQLTPMKQIKMKPIKFSNTFKEQMKQK